MERINLLYHIGYRRGTKFICLRHLIRSLMPCAPGAFSRIACDIQHRSPMRINNYTRFAMRVLVQLPPPLHSLEMTCPEEGNVPIPLGLTIPGIGRHPNRTHPSSPSTYLCLRRGDYTCYAFNT